MGSSCVRVSDLTDFFLGRVVIPPGFSAYIAEWIDRLTHFSYAVYELQRSSSLVTPSAVALGEDHTPPPHPTTPEGSLLRPQGI